jgi:predicted dehydrogenase
VSPPLRVAVVGAGRAGLVHGRTLAGGVRGAVLAGVADPDPQHLADALEELDCARGWGDPLAAATDDEVDALVIASPTFTHAAVATRAAEAGKHVLCEKPLASSVEEGRTVEAAVAASGTTFLMGFMRRFDLRWAEAKERIRAGEIGDPVFVRSTGRGPGLPPEWAWDPDRSLGLIGEVNSHDLDTVRWLSGREIQSVQAVGRAVKRPDIAARYPGFIDLVVVTLELSEGGLAQLDGACPAGYGYDARVEVYGTEGTLLVGGPVGPGPIVVREGSAMARPVRSWRDLFAAAYRAEVEHLVAAVTDEAQPLTDVVDGLRALEAAVAVNRSLREGGRVALEEIRAS